MALNNKIASNRIFRLVTGVVLATIFLVALAAASLHQNSMPTSGVVVTIMNENEHNFIQKKDVERLLASNKNSNLSTKTLSTLDLKQIKKAIEANPWVVKADVYLNNEQKLNIDITQRVPVARLFHTNGSSSYLDNALVVLPLSTDYAYAAPVFTNVPFLGKDSLSNNLKTEMAYLSEVIAKDTFWNAQITQIEVQPNMTFVMIPLLGNQKIVFGDTAFAEDKLKNLFGFYKSVSKKIGWDKYETLDVRFRNQIVASPAIGYIPPKITDSVKDEFSQPPVLNNQLGQNTSTNSITVKPVATVAASHPKQTDRATTNSKLKPVAKPSLNNKDVKVVVAKQPGKEDKKKTDKNSDKKKNTGKTNNHN